VTDVTSIRPCGPAHERFLALDQISTAADLRVATAAKAYIERMLHLEEMEYVEFGWQEPCEGPQLYGFMTVDGWEVDANGRSVKGGFDYEEGFDDIAGAISFIELPWMVGAEDAPRSYDRRWRIHRRSDVPDVRDEYGAAVAAAADARAATEVAAIAAIRERLPLSMTTLVLAQGLQTVFCVASSAKNGAGSHWDDDLINEMDPYCEAIRYDSPSQAAFDAGLRKAGVYFEVDRRA